MNINKRVVVYFYTNKSSKIFIRFVPSIYNSTTKKYVMFTANPKIATTIDKNEELGRLLKKAFTQCRKKQKKSLLS